MTMMIGSYRIMIFNVNSSLVQPIVWIPTILQTKSQIYAVALPINSNGYPLHINEVSVLILERAAFGTNQRAVKELLEVCVSEKANREFAARHFWC